MTPGSGAGRVLRVQRADAQHVVDVMAEAFFDYPVMRFVLGPAAPDYAAQLRRLVEFFVMARVLRAEPVLGFGPGADALRGAATVSYPDRDVKPAGFDALREAVWRELGAEARERYVTCGAVWKTLGVDTPHIHVNMIGVRRTFQGQGIARRLLEEVHALSRQTPGSTGVTLSTEDPANVSFYEHMGYAVVGHAAIAPELETWSLFHAT